MKKTILACLAGMMVISARAQLFNPDSVGGALWGAMLGGVIGGDCRNGFSGDGAAIGAGIGFLAGSLVNESRRRDYYYSQPYVYEPQPTVSLGYGYAPYASSTYVYYAPNAYCAPGYYYRPNRPNYAVGGTIVGAASGALIGAGNHDAGEGAAIGAAAGLVLGTAAEIATQRREKKMAEAHAAQIAQPTQTTEAQSTPPETAPATPENSSAGPSNRNYRQKAQVTSKPCPTSTYHWTARPQIADAPRVPDAPTF